MFSDQILEYAWLIPLLPLAAAFAIAVWGPRWREGGGWVAVAASSASFLFSFFTVLRILSQEEPFERSYTWFQAGAFRFELGFFLDNLTALMLIVVSFVGTLVVIYSIAYMGAEGQRKPRYYAEISLFIGVMLGLVLANNYLLLYVFWELVGLCSYLLIGYWYERKAASRAALKAFLVTRFGDTFFLIGLILLLLNFGSLNFRELFALQISKGAFLLFIINLFIFLGAVGKSAQFPLHDWLPDAMEGPTTVSALIHAATMVKAGVYLVARSFPLLIQTPEVLLIIAFIGGFTALFAATQALVNNDIKRVMAFSTVSQIGYMMLGLGTGGYAFALGLQAAGYTAGLFHLMNHAFFKALLFLGAGSVMHAMGTTDMRQMGGLFAHMKITSITMLIGSLALAGVPPFSGFWSKDQVLGTVFQAQAQHNVFLWLWLFGQATVLMTAFYTFRMWYMTFGGEPRQFASSQARKLASEREHKAPHESPPIMTVPLILLAVLSLTSGFAIFGGFGDLIRYGEYQAPTPAELLHEILTSSSAYLALLLALSGIASAYGIYQRLWLNLSEYSTRIGRFFHQLLDRRYYSDEIYTALAHGAVYSFSLALDVFDRYIVDGLVNGVAFAFKGFGGALRRVHSGYATDYAVWIMAGVVAFLVFYVIRGGF